MKKRKTGFVIIFYGYNHKIEKLLERFNELEHKQSLQIMGDILELNSFKSQEMNQLHYGTPNDFGLFQCRLCMKSHAVHIHYNVEHFNSSEKLSLTIILKCKKYFLGL
jgi:hypothetical protein